jgi:hypothetical protein
MTNKYILAGAIIAGMLTAANVGAPVRLKEFPLVKGTPAIVENALERYAKESEQKIKTIEGKIHRIDEEQKLLETDIMFAKVYSTYNNSGLDIPQYLTRRFLREIVRLESSDDPRAIGKAGERGLTQMTEEAWYEVSKENFKKNAFIPEKSITASIKYFLLIDDFCSKNYPNWQELPDAEKIRVAVASYNGGKENLWSLGWDISKMKPVTKEYIERINRVMDSILPI